MLQSSGQVSHSNVIRKCERKKESNLILAQLHCSYLCGYIYLKSLDMDRTRSLFVHVPAPRENLDVPQMSQAILTIIQNCVKQLDATTK